MAVDSRLPRLSGRCFMWNQYLCLASISLARARDRSRRQGTPVVDRYESPVDKQILRAKQPFVDPRFEKSQLSPSSDPDGSQLSGSNRPVDRLWSNPCVICRLANRQPANLRLHDSPRIVLSECPDATRGRRPAVLH